eukprot:CAMPEP_0196667108 /NCGR_PEP_ID=MMETSP1086-20130531/64898_1 /TAXON_ID=77921 /ORGANISM="Cyanoptyche  gloeocystis , Strain SAG4.97" /LENGTH=317 /DNA_ID=CAMNT_0042004397 /DNA_START=122 /DNA_END=1075 /DNA_ORIENTATION=+
MAKAAVLGSFVADSLALGAHWVYDSAEIATKLGKVDKLVKPTLTQYHTTKEAGDFTHYGDQTLLLLESVAKHKTYDLKSWADEWHTWAKSYTGYLDHATKETAKKLDEGAAPTAAHSDSTDLSAASRIAPLALLYQSAADLPKFIESAKSQGLLTHGGVGEAASLEFWARVLHSVVAEKALPSEAMKKAAAAVGDASLAEKVQAGLASAASSGTDEEAVTSFGPVKTFGTKQVATGKSCALPSALPAAVHFIAKYEGRPDGLRAALVENTMVGGDSAARGMLIGAVLGAHLGLESIPKEWLQSLRQLPKIESLVAKL